MSKGLLPEHIGPLVDRLRAGDHQAISLPDVAALTEVLMRSLESYFKSIDLTIYAECQELADYIDDARQEISSLSPDHENSVGIPRAGLELEAIVQQTESATNTIMESAELIMEADSSDIEAYTTTVNDAVMQIFEACSFQDITGQRISKVVSTLEHVENRVDRLINILGVMDNNPNKENTKAEDDDLLNGPALEGEGIDQSEVDALLNGTPKAALSAENNLQPTPEKTPIPQEDKVAPVQQTKESDNSSDEDIDFMFDGAPKAPENKGTITQADDVSEISQTSSVPDTSPSVKANNAPEKIAEEKSEPTPVQSQEQGKVEKKAKIIPQKPVAYEQDSNAGIAPKSSKNTTQSDIDALFS